MIDQLLPEAQPPRPPWAVKAPDIYPSIGDVLTLLAYVQIDEFDPDGSAQIVALDNSVTRLTGEDLIYFTRGKLATPQGRVWLANIMGRPVLQASLQALLSAYAAEHGGTAAGSRG